MDKKIKRLNIIITITAVLIIICLSDLLFALFSFTTPFKQGNYFYNIEYEQNDIELCNEELKNRIEEIVGVKVYLYFEDDIKGNDLGYSIICLNIIVVDKNLSKEQYILTMTHELCHIKYHTLNERWVCYQMFIHLYNSEFKDIALKFADEQRLGYYPIEYNAWGYIEDYLKEKGEIR